MKRSPLALRKICAFATQGFAQQKARRWLQVQRSRVELHKLDIGNFGAGPERAGHAIAGSHVGIGCVFKDASQATGGEQDGASFNQHSGMRSFRRTPILPRLRHPAEENRSRRRNSETRRLRGARAMAQRANDFAAGRITLRMQDAIAAVRSFAAQTVGASFAIEGRAPFNQLLNRRRRFLDQGANGLGVAKSIASDQRVLFVQLYFVIITECGGNPALRIFGRRFAQDCLSR